MEDSKEAREAVRAEERSTVVGATGSGIARMPDRIVQGLVRRTAARMTTIRDTREPVEAPPHPEREPRNRRERRSNESRERRHGRS